jgi:integrase
MSVYFTMKKGWRYDFTRKRVRYTQAGFKTKAEAKRAEAKRKEEIETLTSVGIPIDMVFLNLANRRLDYIKAYNSPQHYRDNFYRFRRWVAKFGDKYCSELTGDIIEKYLLKRLKEASAVTVNSELKNLRALFNYSIKKKLIKENPTRDIEFLPVEKKEKYVPPLQDVSRVLLVAEPDEQDYLYAVLETLGRKNELDNLKWSDVIFDERCVVLYTRKKKGGHRTPRKIPMTDKLYVILSRRYKGRDKDKPWVFWHRYWSKKKSRWIEGPFNDRKKLLIGLCKKAGVKRFGYHGLRHFGASVLDNVKVPIGDIQRILGHENRKTTEIYLHSDGESEREAMRVFEEVLKKSHTKSHTTLVSQ